MDDFAAYKSLKCSRRAIATIGTKLFYKQFFEYGFFHDKLAALRPAITAARSSFDKVLKTNMLWYSIKGVCGNNPTLGLYSSAGTCFNAAACIT